MPVTTRSSAGRATRSSSADWAPTPSSSTRRRTPIARTGIGIWISRPAKTRCDSTAGYLRRSGLRATSPLATRASMPRPGANAAHDATDRVIYNTSTGQLWYDADGSGAAAALPVATLRDGGSARSRQIFRRPTSRSTMAAAPPAGGQVINGTSGNDTLSGTAGQRHDQRPRRQRPDPRRQHRRRRRHRRRRGLRLDRVQGRATSGVVVGLRRRHDHRRLAGGSISFSEHRARRHRQLQRQPHRQRRGAEPDRPGRQRHARGRGRRGHAVGRRGQRRRSSSARWARRTPTGSATGPPARTRCSSTIRRSPRIGAMRQLRCRRCTLLGRRGSDVGRTTRTTGWSTTPRPGSLYYDADGSGSGAAQLIATTPEIRPLRRRISR